MVPESARASSEHGMRSRFVPILPHKAAMLGSKPEAKAVTWAISVMTLEVEPVQVGSALVVGGWLDRRTKRISRAKIATLTNRRRP
jgi:hypothetical protein